MSSRPQSIPVTSHHAQLLSNGRYAVMLTAAGSGFSRWGDLAVTRWREDPTCDGWGSYVLLSDLSSGAVWSACLQPCGGESSAQVATFSDGRAEFVRRDDTVTTTLDVAVASDQDAELRRVTVTNHGDTARDIALTSYAELVLGSAAADAAHPAFSKLFVQTEAVDGRPHPAGDASAPCARRARSLGGALCRGRRARRCPLRVRNRPRALPRSRPDTAQCPRDAGWRGAVQYGRLRARSDLQPASAGTRCSPVQACGWHSGLSCPTLAKPYSRSASRCARPMPRTGRWPERPNTRPRNARGSAYRFRGSGTMCASGRSAAVCRRRMAFGAGSARAGQRRSSRALDVRHFRRSSDRVAAHRWRRRASIASANCCARSCIGGHGGWVWMWFCSTALRGNGGDHLHATPGHAC